MRSLGLRARLLWLGVFAVVVLVVATGWQWFLRDSAEPATVAQAVHRFRQETTPRPGAGAGLVAGVYVYATMGFEEIDALGGARHGYPPRTTITIVKGGCGWRLRWDALSDRTTTFERCVTSKGYLLRTTGLPRGHDQRDDDGLADRRRPRAAVDPMTWHPPEDA